MLDGDHNTGIVTVPAVAIGAVYASGGYDVWDKAIGFLALFMAFSYAKDERMKVLSFRAMVTRWLPAVLR